MVEVLLGKDIRGETLGEKCEPEEAGLNAKHDDDEADVSGGRWKSRIQN